MSRPRHRSTAKKLGTFQQQCIDTMGNDWWSAMSLMQRLNDTNFDKVDRTLNALFRKGRVDEEYRGEVAYYRVKK